MPAPEAPWDLAAATILWWSPPRVAGAMVSYRETPVGPYSEIMGQEIRSPRRVHVPFIAVDSEDSVAGGRANWNLPKTLASFTGDAASGRMAVEAAGYAVRVRARTVGPALPLGGRFTLEQGDVVSRGSGRGRFRPALVRVDVRGDAGPLRGGTFPGVVAEHSTATLAAPGS